MWGAGKSSANLMPAAAPAGGSLDAIANDIKLMTQNVANIKKMSALLGTRKDSRELRTNMHDVREETKALSKKILLRFKEPVAMDQKPRQDKLRTQFQVLLKEYEGVATESLRREREIVGRMSITEDTASPAQRPSPATLNAQKHEDLRVQLLEVPVDAAVLEERNAGIKQIESDLVDLHQTFQDLATMVNEQQKDLDLIEENVSKTDAQVESGVTDLDKGAKYQVQARKKMCCIAVILIVIIIIVALVIVKPKV
eukprot:TRINITY_DN4628_c0_g1::TRINITY_DN4628_c0_g1_i1::g.19574::m.19574 TRINITY_DN4628_c0_g1::TRINITY_DN4628_c0_g1_i1::g.19574  ORF type:complete len:255 (-),score=58.55,sp/Q86Y82/STX12_HUMAN/26.53/5e-22,Syntaxin_2/PF14523.1/8.4e-16,Syntaxin_2/PF14523.1/2e+02,SNARE/PF05739.14/1.4e+03,SNARE/PF05739.14/9.4e-14,TBPIP/PF07106.8/0.62,TBPIP/PF07106.8/0.0027,Talin_middle/PF09141.5/3.7,Talin_middle/PF09141.5/1.7,Syntaxin/PF00804.20/0.012,Syntaxin/PF00804.20/2.5e+02,ADIP/PF11559.3/7.7e+02,ADIP/PF11559.3/0.026,DU